MENEPKKTPVAREIHLNLQNSNLVRYSCPKTSAHGYEMDLMTTEESDYVGFSSWKQKCATHTKRLLIVEYTKFEIA